MSGAHSSDSFLEMLSTVLETPSSASDARSSRITRLFRKLLLWSSSPGAANSAAVLPPAGSNTNSTEAAAVSYSPESSTPTCILAAPLETTKAAADASFPRGENTPAINPPSAKEPEIGVSPTVESPSTVPAAIPATAPEAMPPYRPAYRTNSAAIIFPRETPIKVKSEMASASTHSATVTPARSGCVRLLRPPLTGRSHTR